MKASCLTAWRLFRFSTAAIWSTTPPTPCCTTLPKASCWWRSSCFFSSGISAARLSSRSPFPFSLLFAAICLSLANIPANLLSLGALDFGMVVEGAVVMVENIIRYLGRRDGQDAAERSAPFARPRTKYNGRCFIPSASLLPPTCPSSRCSAWKAGCSNPWPGRYLSRCWVRSCSRC